MDIEQIFRINRFQFCLKTLDFEQGNDRSFTSICMLTLSNQIWQDNQSVVQVLWVDHTLNPRGAKIFLVSGTVYDYTRAIWWNYCIWHHKMVYKRRSFSASWLPRHTCLGAAVGFLSHFRWLCRIKHSSGWNSVNMSSVLKWCPFESLPMCWFLGECFSRWLRNTFLHPTDGRCLTCWHWVAAAAAIRWMIVQYHLLVPRLHSSENWTLPACYFVYVKTGYYH